MSASANPKLAEFHNRRARLSTALRRLQIRLPDRETDGAHRRYLQFNLGFKPGPTLKIKRRCQGRPMPGEDISSV